RIRQRGRSDEDFVMHGSGFHRMIRWRRSALTGKDARRLVVRPADGEVTALIGRRIGRRGEERAVELAGAVTAIKGAIEILWSGRGGRSRRRSCPARRWSDRDGADQEYCWPTSPSSGIRRCSPGWTVTSRRRRWHWREKSCHGVAGYCGRFAATTGGSDRWSGS